MNFQDLLTKIKNIDEGEMGVMAPPSEPEFGECGDNPSMTPGSGNMPPMKAKGPGLAGGDQMLIGEKGMEECGDNMPGDMMHPPKQTDNVSMNVSMNGSGAGGIADLMKILRNIEQSGHDEVELDVGETSDGGFGDATTRPDAELGDIDCVTKTGSDLASKGAERLKVSGGGNPMQEALVQKLTAHYQRIKEGN